MLKLHEVQRIYLQSVQFILLCPIEILKKYSSILEERTCIKRITCYCNVTEVVHMSISIANISKSSSLI